MNRIATTSRAMSPKVLAVALSLVAGLALAAPNKDGKFTWAPKASGGSFSNISLTTDSCAGVSGTLSVTATGTTNDGGGNDTIWFTIYDDGTEKFAQQINIPVSTTVTTVVNVSYPGTIGGSAPGIGLYLGEFAGDDTLASIDPYNPTVVSGCVLGSEVAVPTLSEWATWALAGMVGLFGVGFMRRRRQD